LVAGVAENPRLLGIGIDDGVQKVVWAFDIRPHVLTATDTFDINSRRPEQGVPFET
jgi:hypothetical protein